MANIISRESGRRLLGCTLLPAVSLSWRRVDDTSRRRMTTTYYDSQSGQHVPIHDESKIMAYLHVQGGYADGQSASARDLGMAGTLLTLPHQQFQKGLGAISNTTNAGELFLHLPSSFRSSELKQVHDNIPDNCNLCFEFDDKDGTEPISERILASTSIGIATSIGIFNPTYYTDEDPIAVAAQVATLVDRTAEQGGMISSIFVTPTPLLDDSDDMVRLCEELTYLDVPGPTIKSRLIVSVTSGDEDELEECLNMGISKFIINYDDGKVDDTMGMMQEMAEEQGKELVLLNA